MEKNKNTAALGNLDKSLKVAAIFQQAVDLHQKGQMAQAKALYQEVLAGHPGHFHALHLLGVMALQTSDTVRGVELIGKALEINPEFGVAYLNRGNGFKELEQYEAALGCYDQAILRRPEYAQAHYLRATVLETLGQPIEALKAYDNAILFKPDYVDAYNNRGNLLRELKRYPSAMDSYDQAIKLNPDFSEAYYNRGIVLQETCCFAAALQSYEKAIELNSRCFSAYNNRALIFKYLGQYEASLQNFAKAIELRPDYIDAIYNRALLFMDLNKHQAAIDGFEKVLQLKPDYEFLYGRILHAKMLICNWKDAEQESIRLVKKIRCNEKVTSPFPLLAISGLPSLQLAVAEIWAKVKRPQLAGAELIQKYVRHQKVRIGYYSADFHNHATAYLMAALFEEHDKTRFEFFAFSFGPDRVDEMRARIVKAFDHFIDVRNQSDEEVAQLSRKLEIDIAIDLKGYTGNCRTGIFASRAAPVQVNYLGYPGTMGVAYMDYLIADNVLIPECFQKYYTESIVYLPDSYQVNDSRRVIAEQVPCRDSLQLPETGFVFCCFNYSYKITPDTFSSWMRILLSVEGSVLWLLEDNSTATMNLRQEAEKRGVKSQRLIFAPRIPLANHLARHRAADLFIDALPYNAHTTASDALWVGLPVLTCMGEAFAARVAASLLSAIGLSELVTTTQQEYESLAIELATNPERLKQIKQKLEQNRLNSPLFDTPRFARNIEDAYMQIYERNQADLPASNIFPNPH